MLHRTQLFAAASIIAFNTNALYVETDVTIEEEYYGIKEPQETYHAELEQADFEEPEESNLAEVKSEAVA